MNSTKYLDAQTEKSFQYLHEVETVAQDILTLKDSKLLLANAHNKFREALRALETLDERRTWMQVNSFYVERPTKECITILKEELDKVEQDMKDVQDKLKNKMHLLRDLEHEPRLVGFGLKPISSAEAKAIHKGFGLT